MRSRVDAEESRDPADHVDVIGVDLPGESQIERHFRVDEFESASVRGAWEKGSLVAGDLESSAVGRNREAEPTVNASFTALSIAKGSDRAKAWSNIACIIRRTRRR